MEEGTLGELRIICLRNKGVLRSCLFIIRYMELDVLFLPDQCSNWLRRTGGI